MIFFVPADLVCFMTFSGNEYHITRFCHGNTRFDRAASVRFDKITFIYAKNDKLIPLFHFEKFKEVYDINSDNYLITERGGHNFLKYETVILGKIVGVLKKN